MGKKFLLFDGNALVHRGYHALPKLKAPDGELVNAVYGFFLVFLKALAEFQPQYVCTSFDRPEPTFRHKKFEDYKAQRPKTPDELAEQIPIIKEALGVFGVPTYEQAGFEADDVIATICHLLDEKELETIIVTGDLDLLQLVDENTKVYGLKRGVKDAALYDIGAVKEKYGFPPALLADWRGLKGDASDNIPGVKGVGPKTATKLLKGFGGLEEVYEAIEKKGRAAGEEKEKISSREKKLLLEGKEKALLSKELAEIRKDVPLEFELERCGFKNYNKEEVEEKFREFGFKTLISRLPGNRRAQGRLGV